MQSSLTSQDDKVVDEWSSVISNCLVDPGTTLSVQNHSGLDLNKEANPNPNLFLEA